MTKKLPEYFRSILWFADFDKISLKKDRDIILFQALEKGRMEHLRYLAKKIGARAICEYARKNAKKFSRKSGEDYYLAGGTALALRLGHRDSIDFDFEELKNQRP